MFADADVCLAPVNTVGEALADPHLRHRGLVTSRGDSRFIRTPIVFHAASAGLPPDRLPIVPARALGADTDDVLRSAGVSESDLAKLRSRHVV